MTKESSPKGNKIYLNSFVIWISSTRNSASLRFCWVLKAKWWNICQKSQLSHLCQWSRSLQKQPSVGFNNLHKFIIIVKRYVEEITKDRQSFFYTFRKL